MAIDTLVIEINPPNGTTLAGEVEDLAAGSFREIDGATMGLKVSWLPNVTTLS